MIISLYQPKNDNGGIWTSLIFQYDHNDNPVSALPVNLSQSCASMLML